MEVWIVYNKKTHHILWTHSNLYTSKKDKKSDRAQKAEFKKMIAKAGAENTRLLGIRKLNVRPNRFPDLIGFDPKRKRAIYKRKITARMLDKMYSALAPSRIRIKSD